MLQRPPIGSEQSVLPKGRFAVASTAWSSRIDGPIGSGVSAAPWLQERRPTAVKPTTCQCSSVAAVTSAMAAAASRGVSPLSAIEPVATEPGTSSARTIRRPVGSYDRADMGRRTERLSRAVGDRTPEPEGSSTQREPFVSGPRDACRELDPLAKANPLPDGRMPRR
uniref:hypothetical protein n=1 Tax=Methylobacterium organophilum TaxID=410 RepID=UPI001EE26F7B|nr:hypothetical protein [Methylobacterium organophilum]